jgi:uncharacterized protein
MRIPFVSMFMTSPFKGLQEHAEKVKECAWTFQQAIECHFSKRCTRFEELRKEIIEIEREADAIKRRVRGHLPVGTLMPVDKFQVFRYLREQDSVMDAVEEALNWISYRGDPGVPAEFEKDFLLLVDAVIDSIDELDKMVKEARQYFQTYSQKQRQRVKEMIHALHQQERQADKLEDAIKRKAFATQKDPVSVFHTVRLAETIGNIADHTENVGDMLRAMIAR